MMIRNSLRVPVLAAIFFAAAALPAESPIPELRWVPEDARLVLVFIRPAMDHDLYQGLCNEILFALGIDKLLQELTQAPDLFREVDRVAVLGFNNRKNPEIAVILRGRPSALNKARFGSHDRHVVRLDADHIALGARSILKRIGAARPRSRATILRQDEWRLAERDPGRHVFGAIHPDWPGFDFSNGDLKSGDIAGRSLMGSLSRVSGIAFSALVAQGRATFRMNTRAIDVEDSNILADGLRAFLISLQRTAKSTAPQEVQDALDPARIRTAGLSVEIEMTLNQAAIARIRKNPSSRALLNLELDEAERERFQNVREIMDLLGAVEGIRVADIGCGSGFFTLRLARAVGPSGRVYAVDIKPDVLAELRDRVEGAQCRQIEITLGAEDDPRLPPNALDAALIVNSYHEMPKHREILHHIRGALKPRGLLLITEPMSEELKSHPREIQEKEHVIAPDLVERDLRQAGFEIIVRNDDFVVRKGNPTKDWLILARKPQP